MGPTPPYRSDPCSALFGRFKIDVAVQFVVVTPSNAHIDNRCAFLDPVPGNQAGFANSADQDIRLACHIGGILGELMGGGYRHAGKQKLKSHGSANMVGCPNDRRVQALIVGVDVIEHLHHTHGCTASQGRAPQCQASDVVRMKTVHIFVGQNAIYDSVFVVVRR